MDTLVEFRPSWWQWPKVLSLDAPIVSVVWLALLGHALRLDLRWPRFFILGSSVWMAYAADRWIEGWRLAAGQVRTHRHRFYQRWRWPIAIVWLSIFTASIVITATRLGRAEIVAGLVLTASVGMYLLSHQFLHRHRRWRVPKEICIAGLLTAGAAVSVIGSTNITAVAAPLALFAGVCFANCALISWWERDVDRVHGQSSLALQSRYAPLIPSIPWILILVGLLVATNAVGVTRTAAECVAMSALLLAVIDRGVSRTGWALAHVLADAALLTPLLVFAW